MKRIIIGFIAVCIISIIISSQDTLSHSIMKVYDNKSLEGITIVVDAGHGGFDSGASALNIDEASINLEITNKLSKELIEAGANVILTRTNEADLANAKSTNRKKDDLNKRMEIINKEEVDLFISIHLNAYADTNVKGSQLFYKKDDINSEKLASLIDTNIKKLTNSKMLIKSGDYFILNYSNKVGVLIECGFISNVNDRYNLTKDTYKTSLAISIKDGIVAYIKALGMI